jgi:hypothetical protein
MSAMRFRRAYAGVPAALGLLAVVALADDDAAPVLHQDVKAPVATADPASTDPRIFGADPSTGANPDAFASGDKLLPQPNANQPKADQEPVLRGGMATDRDTEAQPDRQTGPDSTLHYTTVFNPSVLPFKRMSAMDAVRSDYTLTVASSARQDLTIGGQRSADRDLFWGSLVIELQPGLDVPIPSVAPDMRILSYEIEPKTALVFSKDSGDNYYVRSEETGVSGNYRLVFLADAPARYFSPVAPAGYQVRDIERAADPSILPSLPPAVQQRAESALRQLGVARSSDLRTALDELVYYFRGFEAKASPPNTGDIFWDLFVSQAGVCRHRSFTFMVAASALGIPTRYVTNEAHAFVEVWVPEYEWLRVDLGGAALRMEVDNAGDKTIHRPREADQLAKPPAYGESYTRLEGDISGLTHDQLAEGRRPLPDPADHAGLDPDATDPDAFDPDATDPDDPRIGPGRSLPTLPPADDKTPTEIVVTEADPVGFRGESIRVRGRLATVDGTPVAALRVDVYLAPVGFGGDGAVLGGHGVTDDQGRFTAEVDLPRHLELRDYEVYASTAGDSTYAPALSN